MENSSLSDRLTSEGDAAVFRGSGSRPGGARTQFRSWMRAGAGDWGIRIAVVGLVIGGFFAIYINGVNEGWWHPWGHTPTVTTTGPTAQPTPAPTASSEPAMSGGYQIGPDGVLVRPAEHAPETYTKPELPETAKENSERGAEAAAEHYLALMVYAWNTGDTQPFEDMSDETDDFHQKIAAAIGNVYAHGWAYGNRSDIAHVLRVNPVDSNGDSVPPNTVSVAFLTKSSDGTTCRGQNVSTSTSEYETVLALLMTWQDNRWIVTQGTAVDPNV
ncbi:DUF6318 family protein [Schaalia odontolytica]